MTITLNANEYYNGLVNFILFMRLYATNTSKRQKTIVDELASETLSFGDQKAFPFAELPKVEDYSTTSSLLTNKPIKYTEEFIGNPIKKKISLSTIEPFAKMAMMSASGVSVFFGYIMGLMDSAKYDYLYNEIISDLIKWTPTNSNNKEMQINIDLIDTTKLTTPESILAADTINQQRIEEKLQYIYDSFSIFSDIFIDVDNASSTNFKTAVDKKDLLLISNAKFANEKTVSLMATMLKSDVIADAFKHPVMLKIPEKTFKDNQKEKIIAFVVHRNWYQWFYHFIYRSSFIDPDTVMKKDVLHFWYSKGRLKNLPATQLNANYVDIAAASASQASAK